MRIGLISDTHDNRMAVQKVVEQAGTVALWLHAGDNVRDAEYIRELTGVPVYAVAGNCDARDVSPPDQFLDFGEYRIMLTHGHRYQVKNGLYELAWWGRQYGMNVVVFGHTHKAVVCQEAGLLIINPGSPACPRGGSAASFGILELSPTEMRPTIVELE